MILLLTAQHAVMMLYMAFIYHFCMEAGKDLGVKTVYDKVQVWSIKYAHLIMPICVWIWV